LYGDVTICGPTAAPSTLNCTQATPTLSKALAESVIVPFTVCPALGETTDTVGGTLSVNRIVNEIDWELVPIDAVTVADWEAVTTAAATEKVAVDAPEATVTDAGTVRTAELLFVNPTKVPPEGDG
jgi:hypothetical protein